jgi:hypothetical protein
VGRADGETVQWAESWWEVRSNDLMVISAFFGAGAERPNQAHPLAVSSEISSG